MGMPSSNDGGYFGYNNSVSVDSGLKQTPSTSEDAVFREKTIHVYRAFDHHVILKCALQVLTSYLLIYLFCVDDIHYKASQAAPPISE